MKIKNKEEELLEFNEATCQLELTFGDEDYPYSEIDLSDFRTEEMIPFLQKMIKFYEMLED